MRIIINPTKRKDTVILDEFYREPRDPPGSGKAAFCSIVSSLSKDVKYIVLDASGGTDEKNMRSKWTRWIKKDTRTFGTWKLDQIHRWLMDHNVAQDFVTYVMSEKKLSEVRKWLRILASNESLVKYYKTLGFSPTQKWLLPTVRMKASVNKILASCK